MSKVKKFPLCIHISLTHEEYKEEIISAISDLQNLNVQIEEIFYTEDSPLRIEVKVNIYCFHRDYRTFIIFNHWSHQYSEAVEEIEITGDKTLFTIQAKDIAFQHKQENQHLNLKGSPKNDQNIQFDETVKIHNHLISRDGDNCVYCQSKLNPHTMKSLKVIKELIKDKHLHLEEEIISDINKEDFSIGICAYCSFAKSGSSVQSLTLKGIKNRKLQINFPVIEERLSHIFEKYPSYEEEVNLARIYLQGLRTEEPEVFYQYRKESSRVKYRRNREVKRHTDKQFKRSLKKLDYLLKRDKTTVCCWCSKDFEVHNPPTIDHLIPRSLGGPNRADNYVVACSECNNSRANLLVYKWLDTCFSKKYQPNIEAILLRLSELSQFEEISEIANKDLDRVLIYHFTS